MFKQGHVANDRGRPGICCVENNYSQSEEWVMTGSRGKLKHITQGGATIVQSVIHSF